QNKSSSENLHPVPEEDPSDLSVSSAHCLEQAYHLRTLHDEYKKYRPHVKNRDKPDQGNEHHYVCIEQCEPVKDLQKTVTGVNQFEVEIHFVFNQRKVFCRFLGLIHEKFKSSYLVSRPTVEIPYGLQLSDDDFIVKV